MTVAAWRTAPALSIVGSPPQAASPIRAAATAAAITDLRNVWLMLVTLPDLSPRDISADTELRRR